MTPDELAKAGTEHAHQKALFAWANCAALYGFNAADDDRSYDLKLRQQLIAGAWACNVAPIPALSRLFAIHNQGHGDAIRGGRARAEGVKSGVPDIMLPIPRGKWHGLFIELKKPKTGVLAPYQREWLNYLDNAGYVTYVAYGWREAANFLKDYLR